MRRRGAQLGLVRWFLLPLCHADETTRAEHVRDPPSRRLWITGETACGRAGNSAHPGPTLCQCRVMSSGAALVATPSRSAARCGRRLRRPRARRVMPTRLSCCPQSPSPVAAAVRPCPRPPAVVAVVAVAPAVADRPPSRARPDPQGPTHKASPERPPPRTAEGRERFRAAKRLGPPRARADRAGPHRGGPHRAGPHGAGPQPLEAANGPGCNRCASQPFKAATSSQRNQPTPPQGHKKAKPPKGLIAGRKAAKSQHHAKPPKHKVRQRRNRRI